VLVLPPAPAPEASGAPSAGSGGYHAVTPTRLLDTRTGGRVGLGPHGRVDIDVLGRAGVPASGVTAVVLNLTASCESDDTSLSVWPTGTRSNRPVTGLGAGVTRSVLVTARVGAGGAVSVGNGIGVTELTADVVGYYAAGGPPIQAIASARIYSSRGDAAGKLTSGHPRSIPLPATLGGVPVSRIAAVIVDVSALSPAGAGTLAAYKPGDDGSIPTLNYRQGQTVDNLAVAPVVSGAIELMATGTPVDSVLDVRGVVLASATPAQPGTAFTATKPVLVVDTRHTGGAITAGTPRTIRVTGPGTGVPGSATAVLVDLTAIAPARATSLQVYPAGQVPTVGAALRAPRGEVAGNEVVVPVGANGAVTVTISTGSSHVRLDTHGWFR
jgi:hypothetical protein